MPRYAFARLGMLGGYIRAAAPGPSRPEGPYRGALLLSPFLGRQEKVSMSDFVPFRAAALSPSTGLSKRCSAEFGRMVRLHSAFP